MVVKETKLKISYNESLPFTRYIEMKKSLTLSDYEADFQNIIGNIKKFKNIDKNTSILEIGSGMGWFQLLCMKNGISCKGIDISPQLVDASYAFGQKYGLKPDIEVGNIEVDIGMLKYDVIIATSVFEHVELWRNGIRNVWCALKEGGLFYFVSTNKFSFSSSENMFPLYGWLPNRIRKQLLIWREGKEITELGLDFNQFNYFQLRKFFSHVGFSTIHDFTEFIEPNSLSGLQRAGLNLAKRFKWFKSLILLFAPVTYFICVK
jgi:2-polyprenyl-3-methyl-5-hydroxy-6-metoxy-1,4-benzoquinol methylase